MGETSSKLYSYLWPEPKAEEPLLDPREVEKDKAVSVQELNTVINYHKTVNEPLISQKNKPKNKNVQVVETCSFPTRSKFGRNRREVQYIG